MENEISPLGFKIGNKFIVPRVPTHALIREIEQETGKKLDIIFNI